MAQPPSEIILPNFLYFSTLYIAFFKKVCYNFFEVIVVYAYNVNVAVGNVLRKYREGRCLTQEEFAEICGISRAYYGRIERGEHSLTVEKCQLIASALGIRLADLFNELKSRNIFVRYFKGPRTGDRLRITIGTDAEMDALLDTLSAIDAV